MKAANNLAPPTHWALIAAIKNTIIASVDMKATTLDSYLFFK